MRTTITLALSKLTLEFNVIKIKYQRTSLDNRTFKFIWKHIFKLSCQCERTVQTFLNMNNYGASTGRKVSKKRGN